MIQTELYANFGIVYRKNWLNTNQKELISNIGVQRTNDEIPSISVE